MSKSEGHYGRSHKAGRSSGSHRHTEMIGPGPVAGAGEYEPKGSGKSEETRGRMSEDMYPSRKTPNGKQKVSERTRGDEED